jgi:threonine/homoserine/homoserine lactone efflux protein
MATLFDILVILIQLLLAGFLMWGGWLCLRDWLRKPRAAAASGSAKAAKAPQEGFERVASLVLLALLCTAIVGL